ASLVGEPLDWLARQAASRFRHEPSTQRSDDRQISMDAGSGNSRSRRERATPAGRARSSRQAAREGRAMMSVGITYFTDYAGAQKKERQVSLDALVEEIRNTTARDKASLPLLKPDRF